MGSPRATFSSPRGSRSRPIDGSPARRPHHDSACSDRIPRCRRCRGPRPRKGRTGSARGSRRLDWTWGWPRPLNFARPQEAFVDALPGIGLLRWVLEVGGSFPTARGRGVGTQGPQPPRGRSGNQSVFREALLDAGRWFKRLHVAVELGCSLRARVPKQPGSIVEDHPDLLELHREARPQDAEVALDPDLPEHLVADAVPSIAAVKAPRNPGLKFLSVLTSLGASHRRGAWRGSFPRRAAPWSRSCHPHPTAGSSSTRTSATWCDIRPGRRRAHGEPRPGLDLRQGPVPDGARGQYSLSKAWRRSRTRASRTISP